MKFVKFPVVVKNRHVGHKLLYIYRIEKMSGTNDIEENESCITSNTFHVQVLRL
jgi:hypothetical protein